MLTKINDATNFILSKLKTNPLPKIAIIAGSGLTELGQIISEKITIPFSQIPNFPRSTVESHMNELVVGKINNIPVLLCRGRSHLYEGYTAQEVVFAVRVLGSLGIKTIIITNASGSLNPNFNENSLMLITDHINMTGQNPLIGENLETLGTRFPDMSQVYDKKLRNIISQIALKNNILLHQGVYIGILGPNLETPAETRAFRLMGADCIGMSTIMEVIAAKHMNMRVIGLSCIANQNLPDCMAPVTFEEVLNAVKTTEKNLIILLEKLFNTPEFYLDI